MPPAKTKELLEIALICYFMSRWLQQYCNIIHYWAVKEVKGKVIPLLNEVPRHEDVSCAQ
jgi:hypothetical protein